MCARSAVQQSLPTSTLDSPFPVALPLSPFYLSRPTFASHFLPFHSRVPLPLSFPFSFPLHLTFPFLSFPAYASFSTQLHPSPSFRHLTLPSMSPYACLSHQSWSERSVVGDRRSARLRCRHLLLCFHLSASCGSAKRLIPMSTPLAARDRSPHLPFLFHSTFHSPFYLTSPSPHLPLRCSVSAALGPPSVKSQ